MITDAQPIQVLATLATLPEGATGVQAIIEGEAASLILLKVGEVVRAFHNVCPHAGRPLELAPGRFIVEDGYLICAAHGACFNIPAGECVAGPCRGQSLAGVPIELRDGHVVISA